MRWRTIARVLLAGLLAGAGPANAAPDPIVCVDDDDYQPPAQAPAPNVVGQVFGFKVYAGATPPNIDPARPALVFVQGLHGVASGWWTDTNYYGHNDMYDAAYARGYQTFFLDSFGAAGTALTSIEHGYVLKRQLDTLKAALGVQKFNLIAHSKGGPDSNFAAIMGAPIDSVVTLSGAHYGSPLADLAQVEVLEFLAELLGFNDAGTKFLQTGCMALMRGFLDAQPVNNNVSFYTTAGTAWGPLLSSLALGGLALSQSCPGGDNDGLVCVEHARHPLSRDATGAVSGEHRVVWDPSGDFELDHDNIRMGNAPVDFLFGQDCHVPVFDAIEPYIGTLHHGSAAARGAAPRPPRDAPPTARPATQILRGGPLPAGVSFETFPVEDGVRQMEVRVLVASPHVAAHLIDAAGRVVPMSLPAPSPDAIFRGAYELSASVAQPGPGSWSLRFETPAVDAFAALAVLDGALDLRLAVDATRVVTRGDTLSVGIQRGSNAALSTRALIGRTSTLGPRRALAPRRLDGGGVHELAFDEPGVYSLMLVSEGRTAAGLPFERSRVVSVAVVDPSRAVAGLPQACQ